MLLLTFAPVKQDVRLLTSSECDRLYRRREGTASAAYKAGQLPGRWTGKPIAPRVTKRGKLVEGRPGKTLLVSAKHAERIFGAMLCA